MCVVKHSPNIKRWKGVLRCVFLLKSERGVSDTFSGCKYHPPKRKTSSSVLDKFNGKALIWIWEKSYAWVKVRVRGGVFFIWFRHPFFLKKKEKKERWTSLFKKNKRKKRYNTVPEVTIWFELFFGKNWYKNFFLSKPFWVGLYTWLSKVIIYLCFHSWIY